ncbi:MAG: hypothetical protein ACKE8G_04810 [Methylophagaceae bacterium]
MIFILSCSISLAHEPVQKLHIPLGEEVKGITLNGHLSGRKVYKLGPDINIENCWQDSVQWTGKELYFGLTAINFSELLSGKGFKYKSDCLLPSTQISPNFDIYRAVLNNGAWTISNQSKLNSIESDAAIGVSGTNIAFIRFFNYPKSYDIFLSELDNNNEWGQPVEYPFNSKCKEDNPALFNDGIDIIFESSRKDPEGKKCYSPSSDTMELWHSKQNCDGSWSLPSLLPKEVNKGTKNTQPWVDEINHLLYWTADKEGGVIKRISFDGEKVSGKSEIILRPNLAALANGSAHGQVVFIGEYSEANDYVFIACATALSGGKFMNKWDIEIDLCIIPPKHINLSPTSLNQNDK